MALENKPMTMKNWIDIVDELLKFRNKKVLKDSGKVSHQEAIDKTQNEYEIFKIKQNKEYISTMDEMYTKYINEICEEYKICW